MTIKPTPLSTSAGESSHTPFRRTEKHFKNRSQPLKFPSLRSTPTLPILDFSRPIEKENDDVWRAGWWSPLNDSDKRPRKGKERERGERPELDMEECRKIHLQGGKTGWVVADGCILIPGYLAPKSQLDLLKAALSEYTLPPNPLSLSTHYALPDDLFQQYMRESQDLVQTLHQAQPDTPTSAKSSTVTNSSSSSSSRTTIGTEPDAVVGFEEILAKNKTAWIDSPSEKLKPKIAEDLMKEIRWANLGWVYQWTTKAYDFTPETPIPFPADLREICKNVVGQIPWSKVFELGGPENYSSWTEDYAPDTGIVNFYQLNDTLMGHVDRAELDPSRPLVSVSLGHSCVFLLGTTSRDDPPRPIILRSGDVLIMSGKGRQFYHGVPRIMEGTLPDSFAANDEDDDVTAAAKRWIKTARLNINARQVFPPGFKRPN